MERSKVEAFMMANTQYFPDDKILYVQEKLEQMEESKAITLQTLKFKEYRIALILGVALAADRFYLNDIGLGVAKLISIMLVVGVFWWFIDLFSIGKRVKEHNLFLFNKMLSYQNMGY